MNTKLHDVESLEFVGPSLILRVDGQTYRIALAEASARLAHATEPARRFYRVSPSGYGIHWPEIDEDLTVDGLIRMARETYKDHMNTEPTALKDERRKEK
jgi:hypothetical protein